MYWTKIEGSLYCGQRVQVNIMGLGTGSKSTECTFCTDCSYRGLGLWCLMHFEQYFSYIMAVVNIMNFYLGNIIY